MNEIASPAPELDAPGSRQENTEEPVNLQQEAEPVVEAEEQEDDGLDDLEWEGVKARVPRDLKPQLADRLGEFSKHFTKTSQSNSAKAKELEAREQRISEAAKASEEEMALRSDLRTIDQQLAEYGKWSNQDWVNLEREDNALWTKHRLHIQALRDAKRELGAKITEADTKRTHEAHSQAKQRLEAAEQYAAKNLKGWSNETAEKVVNFAVNLAAKNLGISTEEAGKTITSLMSPYHVELMYLANIGSQTLKSQSAPKIETTAAPLEVVGAKRNPASRTNVEDPNISMEDYVRVRQQQIAARNKR